MSHITAKTKVCMVIGDPIEHSLSPEMHNAGYKKLGIDDRFVYVACQVKPDSIKQFVEGVRAMGIRGVSCTIPHKQLVIPYLDKLDETAEKIGAVNTIVNEHGKLIGYNTDWLGVVTPLEKITKLKGKKVAVLGAGGAARAVVCGILQKGGMVTIFNRTFETAQKLAQEFDCNALPMEQLDAVKDMDIIFNATSVGLHPNENETPLPKEWITSNHIVFDAVYNPLETRLLREAKEQNAATVPGYEMLLYQGIAQFKLYTGHDAPEEIMKQTLLEKLQK